MPSAGFLQQAQVLVTLDLALKLKAFVQIFGSDRYSHFGWFRSNYIIVYRPLQLESHLAFLPDSPLAHACEHRLGDLPGKDLRLW